MTHKIFSFFAGAGFLDYGFETEGFQVVYVNEYHKPFLEAYRYSRQRLEIPEPEFGYYDGSITDFDAPELNAKLGEKVFESKRDGSIVGFIGGPPCPDFSIGGKNRGRNGENGKLSKSYVDLIVRQRPDFFLFENVKGLWKTKKHREFYDELKFQLEFAGYKFTERLTNAIEYGAPQDRERVILLGFLDYETKDSLDKDKFDWLKFAPYPGKNAFSYNWIETSEYAEDSVLPCPEGIPAELTVEYWFRKNDVENHPNSQDCFTPKAGLARFRSVSEGDVSKKSFKRLHRWRYSPTAAYGNNEVHLHPYKSRRISAAEALAIQSLPKNFELPPRMTLSNMFKTVGNGVPYLAAKNLACSIKSFLENQIDEIDSIRHRASNQPTATHPRLQLY
jgi:DNA (cytosine-5)-methyltransferase 1